MKWLYLALAIAFELAGTTCMKLSDGFANLKYAGLMVLFYAACFGFLTLAVRRLEVSTAYAIWSGVGVAVLSLIGIFFFKEHVNPMKLFGLAAIIAGVVALRLSGTE